MGLKMPKGFDAFDTTEASYGAHGQPFGTINRQGGLYLNVAASAALQEIYEEHYQEEGDPEKFSHVALGYNEGTDEVAVVPTGGEGVNAVTQEGSDSHLVSCRSFMRLHGLLTDGTSERYDARVAEDETALIIGPITHVEE